MNDQTNDNKNSSESTTTVLNKAGTLLLGIYLVFLAVFLVYLFVNFWPVEIEAKTTNQINLTKAENELNAEQSVGQEDQPPTANPQLNQEGQEEKKVQAEQAKREQNQFKKETQILWFKFQVSYEVRLILLILIAGALGSFVHVVSSFVDYVGNKKFKGSWTWWYFLRPFSGAVLALLFYLLVRGGLLSAQIQGTDLSRFGMAGIAGLVGLFSKQATDKLSEIFDVVFSRKKPVAREDSIGDEKEKGGGEEDKDD